MAPARLINCPFCGARFSSDEWLSFAQHLRPGHDAEPWDRVHAAVMQVCAQRLLVLGVQTRARLKELHKYQEAAQ